MLEVLRSANNPGRIDLTPDFHRDIRWFKKFLPVYNGVSMYGHKAVDFVLQLDACLTGLGGCWGSIVYHLPIPHGFKSLDVVHLEMANIIVVVKIFARAWTGRPVLVKCDNQAVVAVLNSGKVRDAYLGVCARNVWYVAAVHDVQLEYVHVLGANNRASDLLSRWAYSLHNIQELQALVGNPV